MILKTTPVNPDATNLVIVIVLVLICLIVFGTFFYSLYKTVKNERDRKKYTPNMKQGDNIYVPVMSGSIEGEILEVNQDKIKMVIEVSKSRVYPITVKK